MSQLSSTSTRGLNPRSLSPTSPISTTSPASLIHTSSPVPHVQSRTNTSGSDLLNYAVPDTNLENITTISGSPNLSPTNTVIPSPHQYSDSVDNTNPNQHAHTQYPHVSEASSSQYNSALYPPDRRNPYLLNNFQSISSPISYRSMPSSHSTISSFSAPMSTVPHNQQTDNHQILSQLRLTIDNLNNIISNLHHDLAAVRQQLAQSNLQNQQLQHQLLTMPHNSTSHTTPVTHPPIPTTINTTPSPSPEPPPPPSPTSIKITPTPPPIVLPSSTSIPDTHPTSQNQIMTAFISAQQTLMQNQEKLIAHIIQSTDNKKKPPSSQPFPNLSDAQTTREDFNDWYLKVISLLATEDWNQLYDSTNMDVVDDGTPFPIINNYKSSKSPSFTSSDVHTTEDSPNWK